MRFLVVAGVLMVLFPVSAKPKKVSLPKDILAANAGVKLSIPKGARVMIREIIVFVDGVPSPSLVHFVEPLLKAALIQAGFSVVASSGQVRQEIKERAFERASEEIHQGSLPPRRSILRESAEVRARVHLVRKRRQWAILLGRLGRWRILSGLGLRKKETGAIVSLEITENTSLVTTAQFVTYGRDKDQTFFITGTPLGIIAFARDDRWKRDMKALQSALSRMAALLQIKLKEREPIEGWVLGKVEGMTTTFVAIDIGRLTGVQKGMKFTVHRAIHLDGEKILSPESVATLRALVVGDNNTVCDVIRGKVEDIRKGDGVREVIE